MTESFLRARVDRRSGKDRRQVSLPVLVSQRSGCSRGRRKEDLARPHALRPLFVEDDCSICAILRK